MTARTARTVADPAVVASDDGRDHSLAVAVEVARAADDKKAGDVTVIDVGPIIGICDFFVICSAPNPRLVGAVADAVEERIRERFGRKPISVEGLDDRRWVLVDYGDVVVHVFHDEERAYYRLERLYGDAARVEWEPSAGPASGSAAVSESVSESA